MTHHYELEIVPNPEQKKPDGMQFKTFDDCREWLKYYNSPELAWVYLVQGEERKLIGQLLINA